MNNNLSNIANIVSFLRQKRPIYYIDLINTETGEVIFKKITRLGILILNKNIAEWFYNQPIKKYTVRLYLSNGTSWAKQHEYTINLNENNPIQPQPTEINKRINSGLNGDSDISQLLANTTLYNELKKTKNDLAKEFKKLKKKFDKQKNKLTKTKNELLFKSITPNKTPFFETETGQGLLGAIPEILKTFVPNQNTAGLNAAAEPPKEDNLSSEQKSMIDYIKTIPDKEIIIINSLYLSYKKEIQNQPQPTEATE